MVAWAFVPVIGLMTLLQTNQLDMPWSLKVSKDR